MDDDLIERSDKLDERIAGSVSIDDLAKASRRNRVLIRLLAFSVALDVLLSIGLGALAWQARQVADQANSIQARAYATCQASNEARAGQVQLWHYLLDLTSASPRTPEQQRQVGEVRAYVDHLFAPRRC